MLEYDFLKIINDYVGIYKEFMLPAIICDTGLKAYWGNSAAKSLYPHLTNTDGIISLLSEFDAEELISLLKRDGSVTINDALAFSDLRVSLTPILHNSEIAGVIVIIAGSGSVITPRDVVKSSQTPLSLEKSIRQSVDDIFKIMDAAEYTANMLDSGWVIPSLQSIKRSSYFILRIASNISYYTRFQSQPPELAVRQMYVFDLISQYKDAITGLARDMGIPVLFNLPDAAIVAGIDSELIQIAFFNVLHNALYFTKANNEIEIAGKTDEKNISLIIRDKGMGIPKEALPMIFKPYFSRGHGAKSAGVGLGLTLAKIAVEAHGGSIAVESEENEGTEVTICLPRSDFSQKLPLAQSKISYVNSDRFSYLYVGLVDAFSSPYREG